MQKQASLSTETEYLINRYLEHKI